jgi:cytochrome P450
MLGLPVAEAGKFVGWNNVLLRAYDDPERRRQAGIEINAYLRDLVADRAAEPRDDLISTLLAGNVDGRPVTREEVHNFTFLLFVAGLDTVTAALAFAFRFLAENAAHRRQLVDNPDLVTGAAEELLRVHSFVNTARTVVTDTEIFGVRMKTGDRLLASTTMAAMDSDEFTDPFTVRFDRPLNRHLAFGAGPHRCAGSHLAREELVAALEEFHRRIPDYRVTPGATIRTHGGGSMGMDHLPLTWDVPC